jgi:hypothetical protein
MNNFNFSKISLCFDYWLGKAEGGRGERGDEGGVIKHKSIFVLSLSLDN